MGHQSADKNIVRSTILRNNGRVVSYEEARVNGYQLIDVRSAAEFEAGTMVGAVNIPLFDEHERSVIGTLYHHGGREQAIDKGFFFVEEKLAEILAAFEPFKHTSLAIFCARGGMRSRSIVNLLNQDGYSAVQLSGGYKKYRHDTLATVNSFNPRLIVLHGLTGTGKTRLIQRLENSIDLEELAQHRSSLFGGLDREPSNQRMFESLLAHTISTLDEEPFFVEGESRKIGRVFIPKQLALAMKKGILVNIHCSLETRIARIIEDYPVKNDDDRQQIRNILESLVQKLGKTRVDVMCDLLMAGKLHEMVKILLVDYYDKRYARSMRKYHFDLEVSSENISEALKTLSSFRLHQI